MIIDNRYERQTIRLVRLTEIVSVIVAVFIACIVVDTVYQLPPVKEVSSTARIMYINGFAVLEMNRKFERYSDHEIEIHSVLRKGTSVIPLSHGKIKFDKELTTTITLPLGTEGRYCIDADVNYQYRLSLRQHNLDLNDICLEIGR